MITHICVRQLLAMQYSSVAADPSVFASHLMVASGEPGEPGEPAEFGEPMCCSSSLCASSSASTRSGDDLDAAAVL